MKTLLIKNKIPIIIISIAFIIFLIILTITIIHRKSNINETNKLNNTNLIADLNNTENNIEVEEEKTENVTENVTENPVSAEETRGLSEPERAAGTAQRLSSDDGRSDQAAGGERLCGNVFG